MSLTLLNSVHVLIIFQCFFCTLFLFNTQKGKSISNFILGICLLVLGGQFFIILVEQARWLDFKDYYLPLKFLYGPVIFIYVKSIILKDYFFKEILLAHLIPSFASILIVLDLISMNESTIILLVQSSIVLYLFASILEIRTHRKVLEKTRSNIEKISLNWLKQLLSFFVVIIMIDFFYHIVGIEINVGNSNIIYLIQLLVILSLVSTVVLKGLRYPELFQGFTEDEISLASNEGTKKYSSSSLSNDDLRLYKDKLIEVLENEKLYLNPDLSLNDLSECIGISSRNLSYVINSQFEMNFADLINKYRIKEAVHLFEESNDSKQTVLEVVYEVGFNSKSSFYTYFKKTMGITPNKFKKELQEQRRGGSS